MPTTIALDDHTRQRLQRLKERWGLKSYDEVVTRLLEEAEDLPESMFGVDRDTGLRPLTSKERRAMGGEEEHYDQVSGD